MLSDTGMWVWIILNYIIFFGGLITFTVVLILMAKALRQIADLVDDYLERLDHTLATFPVESLERKPNSDPAE